MMLILGLPVKFVNLIELIADVAVPLESCLSVSETYTNTIFSSIY